MDFFEEFRELSSRRVYARDALGETAVTLSNPVCGDRVKVVVETAGDQIASYGYQAQGCWPVQGCLELMGDVLQGQTVQEALGLRLERWMSLVEGVPASKRHAFSLVHRATIQALVSASAADCARRNSATDAPLKDESPGPLEARSEKSRGSAATAPQKGYTE